MTDRASIKCKPKPNSNWRSFADEAKIRSGFNILTLFSSLGAKLCKTWNRKRILERPLKSYTKYETCFKNKVNLNVLAKNLLLATLLSGLKQHNISSAFDVRILIAHTTYTPLWPVQRKFVWAHPLWYTPAMLPRKDWFSISDKIKIKKRSIANNGIDLSTNRLVRSQIDEFVLQRRQTRHSWNTCERYENFQVYISRGSRHSIVLKRPKSFVSNIFVPTIPKM